MGGLPRRGPYRRLKLLAMLVVGSGGMTSAAAWAAEFKADLWGLCRPAQHGSVPSPGSPGPPGGATLIEADSVVMEEGSRYTLTGAVTFQRGEEYLSTDEALYDSTAETVQAQGSVVYRQADSVLHGTAARLDLRSTRGTWWDATFNLAAQHARGAAEKVERTGPGLTTLKRTTYTTCNPGDDTWQLSASTLNLNENKGFGSAYNVIVRVHGLPIFYLPYITFPISEQRKSGFLTPTLGNSTSSGIEISVPWYWNIAPQMDVTFTPRYLSRRGWLLGGEARYLIGSGIGAGYGSLSEQYLPHDQLLNTSRHFINYEHWGRMHDLWDTNIVWNYVSDKEYFRDLGGDLSSAVISYLERRWDVNFHRGAWRGLARMQSYQIVDDSIAPTERPYQRLPQLRLQTQSTDFSTGPVYRFEAELTRFEQTARINGTRLDMQPELSWPAQAAWGYAVPRVKLRHTQYTLDDASSSVPLTQTSLDRTLPTFIFDTGLFVERDVQFGTKPGVHTLEPRLMYTYTPYRNQDELPVFDTAALDFGSAAIFQDNRFVGADRIGDTQQLAVGLTTRLLDYHNHSERLRAGIGQIYYFKGRRVTLPGNTPQHNRPSSDVVAYARLQLPLGWVGETESTWNNETGQPDKGAIQLRYQPKNHWRSINLAYRFRRDENVARNEIEQTDVAFFWQLQARWSLMGRWNYSLRDARNLQTLAGVEYQSCCWALRFLAREYIQDDQSLVRGYFLQFELKGLMSAGQSIKSMLARGILGYPLEFSETQ